MAETPRPLPPEVSAELESLLREEPERPSGERVGRYVRTERLGAGGMGEVWKAWDTELSRWVALKFLRVDALDERARFEREAQTVARLNHPNIAAVHEIGADPRGRPFIAMQFVAGPTLQRFPRGDRRLLVELVRDAALAVHHAHRNGVVHRDLKPSNLMVETVDGRPRVFVMDFGLAKQTDSDVSLSATGTIVGTPAYMAPEQATGRRELIGPRSDVYALGATLYELMADHPPFQASTALEVLSLIQTRDPGRLPSVERDLETIILHCLQKDPARRYPSAAALADDLARYLQGESIAARPPTAGYRLRMFVRRRKALVATAAAAVIGTLAAVGILRYLTPGTLNVAVRPAGARVVVGGVPCTSPASVRLRSGAHELRVEAPDHDPETREVVVERGRTKDIVIELRRHRGRLHVDAGPAGAEIHLGDAILGSRVRHYATDTGVHRLRARADGCFDQERSIVVRRDEEARTRFSLDSGMLWSEIDADIRAIVALPDLDGDGRAEYALTKNREIVVRSARTHDVVWTIPVQAGPGWSWTVVDGRSLLISCGDLAGQSAWRVRLGEPGRHETEWAWRSPPVRVEGPGVCCIPVGDAVALAGRDGRLWLFDARSGAVRLAGVELGGAVSALHPVRGGFLFTGLGRCGRVRFDGRIDWTSETPGDVLGVEDVTGDGEPDVRWRAGRELGVIDGATGAAATRMPLPEAVWVRLMDIDGAAPADVVLLQPDGALVAMGLWTTPPEHRGAVHLVASATELLVVRADGITELDRATGRRRWSVAGETRGAVRVDGDVVVGIPGTGLRAFDRQGRERWTLRLAHDASPAGALPDADGDGLPEVLIGAHAAWAGVVRPPRTLWRLDEAPPIEATPVVSGADVLLLSHVGGDPRRGRVVCVEGATGTPRWDVEIPASRTRAFAVADWDGDGCADIAHSGARVATSEFVATVLSGRDGRRLFEAAERVSEPCDAYSVPVVADLNGDGAPDFVTQRWHRHDVWAVDGRTRALLWRHPTGGPNMGGLAAADFDGDGAVDVVSPSTDGRVYALRGRDGGVIWSAAAGASRSVPALADLTGDGTQDVLVVTMDGRLVVIDGRSGAILWEAVRGGEAVGRPSVVRLGGRVVIIAPLGGAGVAALDWERRALLWSGPKDRAVVASPVVADLDGDGRPEVVVAAVHATAGEVVILDAESGAVVSRVPLGRHPISADPAVADLDGDGVSDILVATHEGVLHAVSGRVARRANSR